MKPSFLSIIVIFIIIVFFELYFIQEFKTVSTDYNHLKRKILLWLAYVLALLSILLAGVAAVYPPPEWNATMRTFSSILFILLLCKILGSTFLIIDYLILLFKCIFSKFNSTTHST